MNRSTVAHLVGLHAAAVVRNADESDAHRPQVRQHCRIRLLLCDQVVALVEQQVEELQYSAVQYMCSVLRTSIGFHVVWRRVESS